MNHEGLNHKAFGRMLGLTISLAGLLFIPAWTLDYWQAWVFLAVFSLSMLGLTLYLIKSNPGLLDRRLNSRPSSEKSRKQKIIHSLVSSSLIVTAVLPAIDHRCAWSRVPACVVAAGDLLVALGVLIVGLAFKENPFASAIIEVGTGQKIISTGPYAFVRHPMYVGWVVTCWGIPLALGSWWALLLIIPVTLLMGWRLLDEEMFLAKDMPDYVAYQNKVRYRLVPFVW
jgi:protein-S-isoprenylcysteine O-methyltransferase Ste14